jgi:DNA-directed RNA polymerase subunit M/transcription elongation factor TFIIS
MTTVIRGRARAQPQPSPIPASGLPEGERGSVLGWAQKRAIHMLRVKTFAYELSQGLLTDREIVGYRNIDIPIVEEAVRHTLADVELNKEIYGERFQEALDEAVRTENLDFDFEAWDPEFREKFSDFQTYEVVFFRNRTTAFTLSKSCPNCGQKKLVAEGQVFTRSADEAASQFATCKNCSSRFRLHSVL